MYIKELDRWTRNCTVKVTGDYSFNIILTQGLNRQIRRMCQILGYKVVKLQRIRIMNILLGDLQTGQYRQVTSNEYNELLSQINRD
ncbi:MAG: 23S rRNA pseudouridine synthase F, partial [Lachnospira sp.]|nr:23S rRNA pseudouridine synthase F [Lachnospira sp.]